MNPTPTDRLHRPTTITLEPTCHAERALDALPDPCTSAQLAAALGKSPKTVVDWCQEREYTLIPCFRLGNRWYHRVPELVRWLNGVKSGRIEFRRKPRISRQTEVTHGEKGGPVKPVDQIRTRRRGYALPVSPRSPYWQMYWTESSQ
jgi:hypothetical protein